MVMLLGASLAFQRIWVDEYFPSTFRGSASVGFFSPELSNAGNPSVVLSALPFGLYCGGFSVSHVGTVFLFTSLGDGSGAGEVVFRGFLRGKVRGFRLGVSPVVALDFYSSGDEKGVYPSFGASFGAGLDLKGFDVGLVPAFLFPPFQLMVKAYAMEEFSGFSILLSPGFVFDGAVFHPGVSGSVAKKISLATSSAPNLYLGIYGEYFSVPKAGAMVSFKYMAFRVSYMVKFDWFSNSLSHTFEVSMSG